MSDVLKTAISFIIAILSYGDPTCYSLDELMEIKSGNKKVILEHLKAINSITSKAIKEIEGDKDE